MSEPPKADTISFPGGYELDDAIIAIKLAAMKHVPGEIPLGEVDGVIVERFLRDLTTRHPEILPYGDPYRTRGQELFDERSSLVRSHLRLPWFSLAYWAYGLIAVRSGLSVAEYDDPRLFTVPVQGALEELGVEVSEDECVEEIDRFLPRTVSARSVEAAAHTFLSFVRFLHHAALRRRQFVTPRLALPGVGLAFAHEDAHEAEQISSFLVSHGVTLVQQAEDVTPPARLLVVLSRAAIQSETFWRDLAAWKQQPMIPMVLSLMPRTELYREPPFVDSRKDLWTWLAANVAVELSGEADRYLVLLRALDSPDPKQWWWHRDDAIELGLTVEGLGEPPRPPARHTRSEPSGEPYPYAMDARVLPACLFASDPEQLDETTGRDVGYVDACSHLLALRQRPGGQPYALPWFMVVYRAWKAFAAGISGGVTGEDAEHARLELRMALFALGVGTQPQEATAFLESFARLPWHEPPGSIAAADERTVTFIVLVHHLSQAALACGQRVRLQHPASGCFVSYAREDEAIARELVNALEAKGADVWWDINAITMGAPLDNSLRSAVTDARFLLLIATPAADRSPYVRMEIETAVERGLQIVPIVPGDLLPPGIAALQASAPRSFDPPMSVAAADHADAFAHVLTRLRRTPPEQLRWLQAQPLYESLSRELSQARVERGAAS